MKRFTLFFMLVCLTTPLFSTTKATKVHNPASLKKTKSKKNPQSIIKKKPILKKIEEKKEESDSAALIVGTILHSIIPNLLNAVAAKEADDTEEILHSVGGAVQGAGALVLALSKALKRNPHLTPELCLLAYLRSEQGKLFLSKNRTLL